MDVAYSHGRLKKMLSPNDNINGKLLTKQENLQKMYIPTPNMSDNLSLMYQGC